MDVTEWKVRANQLSIDAVSACDVLSRKVEEWNRDLLVLARDFGRCLAKFEKLESLSERVGEYVEELEEIENEIYDEWMRMELVGKGLNEIWLLGPVDEVAKEDAHAWVDAFQRFLKVGESGFKVRASAMAVLGRLWSLWELADGWITERGELEDLLKEVTERREQLDKRKKGSLDKDMSKAYG